MPHAVANYRRLSHRWRPTACAPREDDRRVLQSVRAYAATIDQDSDLRLVERFQQLREQRSRAATVLDHSILIPCFALMFESVKRTLGLKYFDTQLIAGLALATGAIAEMKTGEGKTIVAGLPAALHALDGKGVHVATVNNYLALRDWERMRRPLELLGLTVGISKRGDTLEQKQAAYWSDVTYATGYELGFDFLRDSAAKRSARQPQLGESFRERLNCLDRDDSQSIQRGHAFAIIDEVDSVLIDEASTPLVLSGQTDRAATQRIFAQAEAFADTMIRERDFVIDRRTRTLRTTVAGQRRIYENPDSIPHDGLCRPWSIYIEQALRAAHIHRKDVDYIVRDDKIMLVDHYTGRVFTDRSWRDGLHQAVEHREGVPITPERQSLARISRQRYFGLYANLCGMSGTCTGHERELLRFYRLPVVVIPQRLANRRIVLPTRYFPTIPDKWLAIVEEIDIRHQSGQPTLVGTRTIEESMAISEQLNARGIPHHLLNGCQDENEAEIVSQAGSVGAVTIATNMAGRGTDIHVGEEAQQLGGLHVIATERQESDRIDRQLIGRSARQGQPGSCQFFVSAQDNLVQQFGNGLANRIESCDCGGVSTPQRDRQMRHVQIRAERQAYEQRCDLYQQDRWLNDVMATVAESSTNSADVF